MKRVSFQGVQISAAQRRRLDQERAISGNYAQVNWDDIRAQVNGRVFVGPELPLSMRAEFQPDKESERFWRMAADFKRYGYTETQHDGTPYVGDAFGYSQTA